MLKFSEAVIGLAEVPDEITLCINISNCPCHCKDCHSAYLAEDIGENLNLSSLRSLLMYNKGISCVAFMGGDSNPKMVNGMARWIKRNYRELKIAWYSGRQELSKNINLRNFDFIKLGPYEKDKGPLNKRTTNQRFYEIKKNNTLEISLLQKRWILEDITYKFWKDND